MHGLIAESGGWQTADKSLKTLRGQLDKRKGQLDLWINNLLKHLGDGRAYDTILDKLETLEKQRNELIAEIACFDEEIQTSTVKRPTAEAIQRVWSEMVALWDYVSEDEKTELMSLLVKEIHAKEKNSVDLLMHPIADYSEFIVRNKIVNGSGRRAYCELPTAQDCFSFL